MTARNLTFIFALFFILLVIWLVLFVLQDCKAPAHRWPDWTPSEKRMIERQMKRHGGFTLIRTAQGLHIKTDKGIVWLRR